MVRSLGHPQKLAVALFVLVLALAALVARAEPAAASHGDCTLSVTAPSSYLGTAVITSGSVDCASTKSVLRFSIALTRDGSLVSAHERTCHKASTCWSYIFADDPTGDQRYCNSVSARVGSHSLPATTSCEGEVSP